MGDKEMTDERENLMAALRDLNNAAYAAVRAGRDAGLFSDQARQEQE